ncbi:peptide deformylase [Limosilactobacillus sp.]|uniref:peptide deformylase n=1 Tax=Limosilactobacillus sp. TaxID=2773925 RepID=UPI003F0E9927
MIKTINKDLNILKQVSQPATKSDLPLGQDLKDTLTANAQRCVGMAANMIGVNKRVIIAAIGPLQVVMFNPQLIAKRGPYQTEEGCLSLTGQRATTRYQQIKVRFYNDQWQVQELALTGFPAEIVQHELDHCDGILI